MPAGQFQLQLKNSPKSSSVGWSASHCHHLLCEPEQRCASSPSPANAEFSTRMLAKVPCAPAELIPKKQRCELATEMPMYTHPKPNGTSAESELAYE